MHSPPRDTAPDERAPELSRWHARALTALVFYTSAAVLVVEITALRLLAPYLGLTLETSTLVIALALAAIAIGSAGGGMLADRVPAPRLLVPALGVSAVVVIAAPAVLNVVGSAEAPALLLVAGIAVGVPGALLSAVTPIVTKLRLRSLAETGGIVGGLSATSSVGAIAGTVLTGYVLIAAIPIRMIHLGLGISLLLLAIAVAVAYRGGGLLAQSLALTLVLAGVATAINVAVDTGCDVETRYHCAVLQPGERDGGVTLVLDGLRHSYVDTDDPQHLEFEYVQAIASVADALGPGEPGGARTLHLGGGGMSIPRYLVANWPGSHNTVYEVDPGVVAIATGPLRAPPEIDVRETDARIALADIADGSQRLVVGDAFGGVSAAWHLTTTEALAQIRRTLTPDGVYAANVIDFGSLAFVRAQLATFQRSFAHVALLARPSGISGERGGNFVGIASQAPLPIAEIEAALENRSDWVVIQGAQLDRWIGDATVLSDDFAPVDQLLTPYPTR